MIVNPLTGKHIKANGKLAQKLLKMHRDKEVKLKRGDVKLIKDGGGQHGGNNCDIDNAINNLPRDVVEYMNNNHVYPDVTFLAKLACFEKQYLEKYKELIEEIGKKNDGTKIEYLNNTFGKKTLEFINNTANADVKRIIEKFTISDNDDGPKYREFINYDYKTGDNDNTPPTGLDDYWVLKHINICCKPERIYWLLQKIAQYNDANNGKRSYLELYSLSSNIINIPIDDTTPNQKKTVVSVLPNLLTGFHEPPRRNDMMFNGSFAMLTLNDVIQLLKGIDIKRKVHIGI